MRHTSSQSSHGRRKYDEEVKLIVFPSDWDQWKLPDWVNYDGGDVDNEQLMTGRWVRQLKSKNKQVVLCRRGDRPPIVLLSLPMSHIMMGYFVSSISLFLSYTHFLLRQESKKRLRTLI
jgi:acyl-CoA synthetase (AMP-forming)/AMP-acid ligase II